MFIFAGGSIYCQKERKKELFSRHNFTFLFTVRGRCLQKDRAWAPLAAQIQVGTESRAENYSCLSWVQTQCFVSPEFSSLCVFGECWQLEMKSRLLICRGRKTRKENWFFITVSSETLDLKLGRSFCLCWHGYMLSNTSQCGMSWRIKKKKQLMDIKLLPASPIISCRILFIHYLVEEKTYQTLNKRATENGWSFCTSTTG